VSRPTLTLIAGANGSGKTTLTRWNPDLFGEIPLLDPDAVANTLQASASVLFPMAAARHVLKSAREHVERGESFAVETTLAGKNYLQMMLDARNRGFEIVLVYIGTENVEKNLARIRTRVLAGATMFPRKTFGDATDAASKTFPPQWNERITPSCSTTPRKMAIA
jgi:predicted ABC-type ATPase